MSPAVVREVLDFEHCEVCGRHAAVLVWFARPLDLIACRECRPEDFDRVAGCFK